MKQVVFDTVPSGFIQTATVINGQLHAVVEDAVDHSEAIFAAVWDGQSPYLEVLQGDVKEITHSYLGWPLEEKSAYLARTEKAIEPAVEPVQAEPAQAEQQAATWPDFSVRW